MVSMGGYVSGDGSVRKIDPILYDWSMMFAADDISPAVPITKTITEGPYVEPTMTNAVNVVREAYQNQRTRQIEDEILQPIGLSMDAFLRNGKNQLSERAYERVYGRIESYDLGIEFVIQGFDAIDKEPHIFTVGNPGKCNFYDKVGFWAIGSGQHQAIASLFATQYSRFNELDKCVAKVLVAKFMAESSVGVGKDTFLIISRKSVPNKALFIDPPLQRKVRDQYEALPKIPLSVLPEIKQVIDVKTQELKVELETASKLLASQKSKPKP
jgi:hypothetical protein